MVNTAPPLIGITLDSSIPDSTGKHAGYSQYAWYAVREKYPSAVAQAGGLPLMLSHEENFIDTYLSFLQGLIITGGRFDIDPSLYGDEVIHPSVILNPKRTHFEFTLLKKALQKNLPILGICGGQQLLNVAFGGTLIQDILSEHFGLLPHYSEAHPLHTEAHLVSVHKNTQLSEILSTSSFYVNSAHHQAVKTLGHNLKISAESPDGLIEAFESTIHSFVMGIQWHPEFLLGTESYKIFEAFIKEARVYAPGSQ